jgi:hypothetical protein
MPSFGASIRLDTASPFANAMARAVDRRAWLPKLGAAASRTVKDHLSAKQNDSSSHDSAKELGAKISGLYAQMVRATSWQVNGDSAVVSIAHPAVRQRLEGGTIRPVNGNYLTIPARASVYGKRVRDAGVALKFGYAFDEKYQAWRKALVAESEVRKNVGKARKDGSFRTKVTHSAGAYFWLIRSANQAPDPTVLPTDQVFAEQTMAALRDWSAEVSNGR